MTLYTYKPKTLISAIPRLGFKRKIKEIKIKAGVPDSIKIPSGCRLSRVCPNETEICFKEEPPMMKISGDHFVACHLVKN